MVITCLITPYFFLINNDMNMSRVKLVNPQLIQNVKELHRFLMSSCKVQVILQNLSSY